MAQQSIHCKKETMRDCSRQIVFEIEIAINRVKAKISKIKLENN